MQHLEVSGAVRHIYVIRRLKVKATEVISTNFSYRNPALNLSNTKWKC